MSRVVAVLVSLPPEKSGNLIPGRVRVILFQVLKNVLGTGDVTVVLQAGVPGMLGGIRDLALRPARITNLVVIGRGNQGNLLSALLVGCLDLVARTAGRKEIPAEATVADRTLEDQYGFIQRAAELRGRLKK